MKIGDLIGRWVARRKDSERLQNAEKKREETRLALKKLGYLRISDPEISRILPPLLLAGEAYLRAATEAQTYDPLAHQAVVDFGEFLKIHLTEADETAVEKRFSLEDQTPFPDAKSRILGQLNQQLKILTQKTLALKTALSGPDQVTFREEL